MVAGRPPPSSTSGSGFIRGARADRGSVSMRAGNGGAAKALSGVRVPLPRERLGSGLGSELPAAGEAALGRDGRAGNPNTHPTLATALPSAARGARHSMPEAAQGRNPGSNATTGHSGRDPGGPAARGRATVLKRANDPGVVDLNTKAQLPTEGLGWPLTIQAARGAPAAARGHLKNAKLLAPAAGSARRQPSAGGALPK